MPSWGSAVRQDGLPQKRKFGCCCRKSALKKLSAQSVTTGRGGLVKVKGGAKPAKAHDASRTKCCRNLAQIITIIMYSTGTVQAKVPLGSFWLTERLFT